ncbi:MAG TPA: hypothetical protein VFA48_03225 [Gammaproteobacteria bacterium]|nr:hypothetical protein [Gammaproteobacteria bacterium]
MADEQHHNPRECTKTFLERGLLRIPANVTIDSGDRDRCWRRRVLGRVH